MNRGASHRGLAFVCDRRGLVQEVLLDSLGVLPTDLPGRALSAVIAPWSSKKMFRMLDQVRRGKRRTGWELDFRVPDETTATLRAGAMFSDNEFVVVATPLEVDLGDFVAAAGQLGVPRLDSLRRLSDESTQSTVETGLQGLAEVNNDLVVVQRELSMKNQELTRAIVEKNRLLGMVAHDLRGPLNAITLTLKVLDRLPAGDPRTSELVARLHRSCAAMEALVNDSLDLSSIEAGRLEIQPAACDLRALVERVAEIYEFAAEERGMRLKLKSMPEPVMAWVDSTKIEQVLGNLLGNALKHTQTGSLVEVSLVGFDLEGTAGSVILEVRDSGPGIPKDRLATIFNPFEGKQTSQNNTRTTGLGLAIAKRIVDGHGGRIEVESVVGQGTTFRVWLPKS